MTLSLPIRLDQFLKLADLVGSGGEAKVLIQEGQVKVNSELEVRRGRKLVQGDQVEVAGSPPVTVGEEPAF